MDRPAHHRQPRVDRACLAIALAIPIGWFFVYNQLYPHYLVDESGHIGNVYHFLEGKPGWPEQMTMLPGYHFLVTALWQLDPPFSLLTLARLVSTLFALAGLAAFAAAWQRIHGSPPGRATLLFALLPILQPFTGMAYTDVPALALVLAALALHLRGHRTLATLLFVAAVFVRQSNLLWVAFLIAWEWLVHLHPVAPPGCQLLDDTPVGSPWRRFARRTAGLWLVLAGTIGLALAGGRLTVGNQTGTALQPNIATLHFAALLVLLLGLPAWLAALPAAGRRTREVARQHPLRAPGIALATLGIVIVLARTFANPHLWNREVSWPDATFTLLRNWPLVWIDSQPALRGLSAAIVAGMAVGLCLAFARQPHRRELWLALGMGALLPFGQNLVEPRYFIPAAALALLYLEMDPNTWRRLAIWWALLCLAHAPFIARGLSLW